MSWKHLLCFAAALLLGSTACAPVRVGPTVPSGYFFHVLAPSQIFRGEPSDVIVRVQDAQGKPVDGVAVMFEVEPGWATDASLTPSRVLTQAGMAQSTLQADLIGRVQITAQVEQTTQTTPIAVSLRGSPSSSP